MQIDKLYEAAAIGDVDVLNSLIKNDNVILDRISLLTCCNETPLHIAALRGHLEFMHILVQQKPGLTSIVDVNGRTPLHLASAKGYVEIVKEMILVNFQVCISRDGDGRTPLHLAVMNEQVEVIQALLEMVPLEIARESIMLDVFVPGETIMHLCVKHRRLKSLKLLVEWHWGNEEGKVVNSKDHGGNTLLHLAAIQKDVQTTKYLLSRNIIKMNANSVNDNGFTAMEVSEQFLTDSKSMEIRKLLREAGVRKIETIVPHSPSPSDDLECNLPKPSCLPSFQKKACIIKHQPHEASECGSWTANKVKRMTLKLWHYIQADSSWLKDVRGNLMVAATVTATMAFQAGLNPPGGVWQNSDTMFDSELNKNITFTAGYSVAATRLAPDYNTFVKYNTTSLVASLSIILLMISGFPLNCMFSIMLLVLTMCTTVVFILLTYIKSIGLITDSNETFYETYKVSAATIFFLYTLCSVVLLICFMRLAGWLWPKLTMFRRRLLST